MSAPTLLDRQISLVTYLTTPRAYESGTLAMAPDLGLAGLDPERLRIVGRLSLAKRMEKVAAVLLQTTRCLDADFEKAFVDFAERYPPHSATRYDNAVQFHDFLLKTWEQTPPEPPYLPDVAAFEVAFARVRFFADDQKRNTFPPSAVGSRRLRVRRCPETELLRCAYDVRSLFDAGADGAMPEARDTLLIITCADPLAGPRVFEVTPNLFGLLARLDDWVVPEATGSGMAIEVDTLLPDLVASGMVEVAP